MSLIEQAPAWYQQGMCWGRPALAPLFFPADDDPAQCQDGRRYCQRCPVAEQCRDYAIAHEIHHGLWGGLTPRERERYRRNPAGFILQIASCEECGEPLTGQQRTFCSTTCVRKSSRRRKQQGRIHPVTCRQCGKEFTRANSSQTLCGPECRQAAVAVRQQVRRGTPRVIACWICNTPLERSKGERYCSDPCRAKARANSVAVSNRRRRV